MTSSAHAVAINSNANLQTWQLAFFAVSSNFRPTSYHNRTMMWPTDSDNFSCVFIQRERESKESKCPRKFIQSRIVKQIEFDNFGNWMDCMSSGRCFCGPLKWEENWNFTENWLRSIQHFFLLLPILRMCVPCALCGVCLVFASNTIEYFFFFYIILLSFEDFACAEMWKSHFLCVAFFASSSPL